MQATFFYRVCVQPTNFCVHTVVLAKEKSIGKNPPTEKKMSDTTTTEPKNEFVEAVARQIGRVAEQGAAKALDSESARNAISSAFMGARAEIERVAAGVRVPGASTTTRAPAKVIFPGTSATPVAVLQRQASARTFGSTVRAPLAMNFDMDTGGENAVAATRFSGQSTRQQSFQQIVPPGGLESAEEVAQTLREEAEALRNDDAGETPRDQYQKALTEGPAALRMRTVDTKVSIPVSKGLKTKSDGVKPEKTEQKTRTTPRRIIGTGGAEGWPAGIIIESKHEYGPQGVEAMDIIDESAVKEAQTQTDASGWPLRIAVGVAFLFLIAYVVTNAINRKKASVATGPSQNMTRHRGDESYAQESADQKEND